MVSSKGFPASDADAGYGECMPLQGILAATYTSAFLDLPCQANNGVIAALWLKERTPSLTVTSYCDESCLDESFAEASSNNRCSRFSARAALCSLNTALTIPLPW